MYNQVLPGILPIIGPGLPTYRGSQMGSRLLRRSLRKPLSTQCTEGVSSRQKCCQPSGPCWTPQGEDPAVTQSAVQAAASLYPLVFRRVYVAGPIAVKPRAGSDRAIQSTTTLQRPQLWQELSRIKLNILQRMDSAPIAVRICCVKFAQKVVQVETPGLISDPRVSTPCY